MRINASALRPGNVIELEGRFWVVIRGQNISPGKGGAYMQAELRDVQGTSRRDERFRSTEQVERVSLEDSEYQYLFGDGNGYTFMNGETYEQVTVPAELVGDRKHFLQEGMACNIRSFGGVPLVVELPQHCVLEVVETEPVLKSQTAAASYKPAILSNGVRTTVPPHIVAGTQIVVSTADGSYVGRHRKS